MGRAASNVAGGSSGAILGSEGRISVGSVGRGVWGMPSRRRKPVCLQMGQVGSRDCWSMVPQCRQTHGEDGVGGAGCGVRGSGAGISSATLSRGCRWSGARPRRRSDSTGTWQGEWSSAMAYARAITAPSGRAAAGRTSGRSS